MGVENYARDAGNARGLHLALDNEGTQSGDEVFFREAVFDEADNLVSPRASVLDRDVVTVLRQKLNHRDKACPLVALLKSMRLDDTRHQPDSQNDNVLLAIAVSILRTCECALDQPLIAQKIPFAGDRHQPSIYFNDRRGRQPPRLILQEPSECSGSA